jgi:hypothetical protein
MPHTGSLRQQNSGHSINRPPDGEEGDELALVHPRIGTAQNPSQNLAHLAKTHAHNLSCEARFCCWTSSLGWLINSLVAGSSDDSWRSCTELGVSEVREVSFGSPRVRFCGQNLAIGESFVPQWGWRIPHRISPVPFSCFSVDTSGVPSGTVSQNSKRMYIVWARAHETNCCPPSMS